MTNTPPTIPSGPGIRRVGIPPVTSFDQGEELRTVMDLLGHSTIRLTADTYGHVLPTRARNAVDAIDRVLGGAQ
jgi:integrase